MSKVFVIGGNDEMSEKLRRAVIKEELVALTGDYKKAIILNQFLYWSERMKDFDKYIKEENERIDKYEQITIEKKELLHGWIYKTAKELSEEIMTGMSPATIGRQMDELLKNGWLDKRTNPQFKWDQTLQYRVNIVKIQVDLFNLGYALEGYKLPSEMKNAIFKMKNGDVVFENAIPKITSETTKINIIINNNIVVNDDKTTFHNKLIESSIALDKTSSIYVLNEMDLQTIEEKDLKNDFFFNSNSVSYSAPLPVLLFALLQDSKTRKKMKVEIKTKIAGSLAKVLIRAIKLFNRPLKETEIAFFDELLTKEGYSPSVIVKGLKLASEKNYNEELNNSIIQYIDEIKELEKMNKLNFAKEKYEQNNKNKFGNKPKPQNDFQDFGNYEEF